MKKLHEDYYPIKEGEGIKVVVARGGVVLYRKVKRKRWKVVGKFFIPKSTLPELCMSLPYYLRLIRSFKVRGDGVAKK